ncbi:MAG: hypothetical protein NC226_06230 [Bacteroides cellulosilyticus]|nr:hypothetical protein [Bacteroides cellulosilyticus]
MLLALAACCTFSVLCPFAGTAQPLGIAYYDVDRLYDTVVSPFYNDSDYTPEGRLRWDTERYRRKIARTAAVIDSMSLPIVALYGVENEAVVRDLVRSSRNYYAFLHRTLNGLDGLDFALLYYGDRFFPHFTEPGNGYLYIEGTLSARYRRTCDTLGLLLCHREETADWLPQLLREEHPNTRIIILGRFKSDKVSAYGFRDATTRAEKSGHGNRFWRNGWEMRDRIAADTALRVEYCDVYIRRWLLDPADGKPLPTYDYTRYRGGCGRSLPIFVYISRP